jgi:hypothetical protein
MKKKNSWNVYRSPWDSLLFSESHTALRGERGGHFVGTSIIIFLGFGLALLRVSLFSSLLLLFIIPFFIFYFFFPRSSFYHDSHSRSTKKTYAPFFYFLYRVISDEMMGIPGEGKEGGNRGGWVFSL